MKITRVTITGADDKVEHRALSDLSEEFPFVEWGVLVARGREGTPRYPQHRWIHKLFFLGVDCAAHYCGAFSRNALSGDITQPTACVHTRVQLNGFSRYRLPLLHIADVFPSTQYILQCQDMEAVEHAAELAELHQNVSALWDIST